MSLQNTSSKLLSQIFYIHLFSFSAILSFYHMIFIAFVLFFILVSISNLPMNY